VKIDLHAFAVPAEWQLREGPKPNIWPRWFRSENVVDLWDYRPADERKRIADMVYEHWLKANGGYPKWPP
jgi:hypothetical protein